MTTIARDLGHILTDGIPAMITAILRIASDRTNAHFMFTFSFICHSLIFLVYAAECYTHGGFLRY
jgi:hypothetical protein